MKIPVVLTLISSVFIFSNTAAFASAGGAVGALKTNSLDKVQASLTNTAKTYKGHEDKNLNY